MTANPVRNGLRAGSTFSVVVVFLTLIGFTVTGSGLIAKTLGSAVSSGRPPSAGYLVIFLALLGIWGGSTAARPDPRGDRFSTSAAAGLLSGLVIGVISSILALVFSVLLANKVDPRGYLSMVSPDSMKLFLFNLNEAASPAVPAVLHLVLQLLSGAFGGAIAYIVRRLSIRQAAGSRLRSISSNIKSNELVGWFQQTPYAIYILYALIAIVLFFLPRQWGSYWNYIIGTVGIYVILGLGLNIIVGLAGQLVLGYVAFFAIGAYTVALLTAPQPHGLYVNFWATLVIAIVLSALTGLLLGLPIMRLRGDYLAIVTLGFGEIIRILLRSDLLTGFTAGPKGVRAIAGPILFGQPLTSDINFLYLIIVAVLASIFITDRLQNSRTGRSWVAIREDEIAARASGINTTQSKLLALAIGAAFAGLGGMLFASRNQFTGPEDHTLMVSINVLALVIVGGMGSIPGIILGAFALKGLPEMLRELENYRLMVFGGLLVMMMILRPEGLWPGSRPKLEKAPERQLKVAETAQQVQPEVEGVKNASKP